MFEEPAPGPLDEPRDIFGEWAGYISQAGSEFPYAEVPTYAAKLTIDDQGAWLSLDLVQEFLWNEPVGGGLQLSYTRQDEASLAFSAEKYAYRQGDMPLDESDSFTLEYHPFYTNEEREAAPIIGSSPAFYRGTGDTHDMLYGVWEGWTLSFARLESEAAADELQERRIWPRWDLNFSNLDKNVRGVYGFGETGADNINTTNVFVYADPLGYEHIRYNYNELFVPQSLRSAGVFMEMEPVWSLGLGMSQTPVWETLYALDTETGAFTDVSESHREYYRDEILPEAEQTLLYERYDALSEPDYNAVEEYERYYSMACFAAYGHEPKELPQLLEPKANSDTIFADMDGDGESETIQVMFFDFNGDRYGGGVWFNVDGEWNIAYILPGDTVEQEIGVVDWDISTPGVELAFECAGTYDRGVELFTLSDGQVQRLTNGPIAGSALHPEAGDAIVFRGDGTATGYARCWFAPQIIMEQQYATSSDEYYAGLVDSVPPENGLYKLLPGKPLVLKEPLIAYLTDSESARRIEIFAGQGITPTFSDGWRFWGKTASGQAFCAEFDTPEQYPVFE